MDDAGFLGRIPGEHIAAASLCLPDAETASDTFRDVPIIPNIHPLTVQIPLPDLAGPAAVSSARSIALELPALCDCIGT